MIALEYLKSVTRPMGRRGDHPVKISNSELKRMLNKGSVRINYDYPKWDEEISFPITDVVYFPKSKHKVTLWHEPNISFWVRTV